MKIFSREILEQLEAAPLLSNKELLDFNVRSRDINWTEHVQPLAQRAAPVYLGNNYNIMTNYRQPVTPANRRKIFICHDMMGNYMEDRHFNTSQKFDDYRFFRWPGVDYFCYFSHNYITIPPCGWINAAHKHGVPILGTYIVESTDGAARLQEVLRSKAYVDAVVDAMTKLCLHFGFEGWLVNVEVSVHKQDMENLYYFVDQLRSSTEKNVPQGIVFWYDSVVNDGNVSWQNEINAKNVHFFQRSNATLINYMWNDHSLRQTDAICRQYSAAIERVYFGIDVFGRGQIAKFRTRQTLQRIAKYGFSAGIFAPAWTFETLQTYQYNIKQPQGASNVNEAFLSRDEKWWATLWEFFATHPYEQLPFYTNFCLGSGKSYYQYGKPTSPNSFFNLSQQSLQPSVPLRDICERNYDNAYHGGSSLALVRQGTPYRIFATDFKLTHGGLVLSYAFKLDAQIGEFDCVLRFCAGDNKRDCYIFCGDYSNETTLQRGLCYICPYKPEYLHLLDDRLVSAELPKTLAQQAEQTFDWRVRYYVVGFDAPVQIKDIGILYRQNTVEQQQQPALLGALYVQQFDINVHKFPSDSNYVHIQISDGNLLNLA